MNTNTVVCPVSNDITSGTDLAQVDFLEKKSFFYTIMVRPHLWSLKIFFAYWIAWFSHFGEYRKSSTSKRGIPYIYHPRNAALRYIIRFHGNNADIVAGILTHDVRESVGLSWFCKVFGVLIYDKNFLQDLDALTKRKEEEIEAYIDRIIDRGMLVIIKKLFDVLDNMLTLGNCSVQNRAKQIKKVTEIYLPKLLPALRCCTEVPAWFINALEKDINDAIDIWSEEDE